jgi:hypothetical protein
MVVQWITRGNDLFQQKSDVRKAFDSPSIIDADASVCLSFLPPPHGCRLRPTFSTTFHQTEVGAFEIKPVACKRVGQIFQNSDF